MRRLALVIALVLARPAAADQAGDFAYYVLALSWSPSWCLVEGDARRAAQCDPVEDTGFILHGLWPQHLDGWPEYCEPDTRDPTPAEAAAMADIMGSEGLARHEWEKHGTCSGLGPEGYYALSRQAFPAIRRPERLRALAEPARLAPAAIERAFLAANPTLAPEAVSVTCRDGLFREVRICLDRALAPRPCTGPAARECPLPEVVVPRVR